jgi:hypothetical protein
MNIKRMIVLFSILSLMACTTMESINSAHPDLADDLEPGEKLVLHMHSGQVLTMTLISFDGETLHGTGVTAPTLPLEINIQDVRRIVVERLDGNRTLRAISGVLLIVLISAAMVGLASSSSSSSRDGFDFWGSGSN